MMVGAGLLLSACRPEPGGLPATPPPAAPVTTASALPTTPTPVEAPVPIDLTDLGLRITPAEGWTQRQAGARTKLLPVEPQPVLLEGPGAGDKPLLLLAKVAEANLGAADPAKAPAAILAGLRKSLDPGLAVSDATAPTLNGLTGTVALRAAGAFPALGLGQATALFITGLGSDQTVYLVAYFVHGDAAQKAVDTMLGSLAPLALTAEAPAPPPAAAPTATGTTAPVATGTAAPVATATTAPAAPAAAAPAKATAPAKAAAPPKAAAPAKTTAPSAPTGKSN